METWESLTYDLQGPQFAGIALFPAYRVKAVPEVLHLKSQISSWLSESREA